MQFGVRSMFTTLRIALVRPPDRSFAVSQPSDWGYASSPNLEDARNEHRALVDKLEQSGVEVVRHQPTVEGMADSIFVYDPVLMTPGGAILLRMGKELRRREVDCMEETLRQLEIPVVGNIWTPGTVEGGDLLWLDSRTVVAGLGFRTNLEGVRQLSIILEPLGIQVRSVELPFFKGPNSCLHLLSLISLLDHDLAVCHPPLMSVPFFQTLSSKDIELVEIPDSELDTQACNVLALAPRKVLILEENVETIRKLEGRNCEVVTYRGREISHQAEGGPTCLVLPIYREVGS